MKIKISFMALMLCFSGLLGLDRGGAHNDPAVFDVFGWDVHAREMAELNRDFVDHVREVRAGFDHRFAGIVAQKNELERLRREHRIDDREYEERNALIARELSREEKDEDAARQNGQTLVGTVNGFANYLLERQREKDQRATKIAQVGLQQEVANEGAKERLKMLLEKDNLIRIGIFLSLTTAGVVGSYYVLSYLYRYFEANMGMPTLIRESSRSGWKDALFGGWLKKKHKEDAFDDVVLAPEVNMTVLGLAKATALTHEKGLQYRHLLLYGPPGTGKTLIAKTMARSSGMDYAIISGADFSQFKPGTDVQKLHEAFDWADSGSRGLILFIDEADALLRDRKKLDERGLNLIEAFLSRTNASSDKFMIILATNYPETLDAAVLSRINKKVNIPLPGKDERFRLLKLYTNKYLLNKEHEQEKAKEQQVNEQAEDKTENKQRETHQEQQRILNVAPEINEIYLMSVAEKTEGFSGRDIDQLLGEIRIEGFMTDDDTVTKQLFDRVVECKKAQQQQEVMWANKK